MNYPSIGHYLDALASGQAALWRSGAPLWPTYDAAGEAIYSSGNFGVVFRAADAAGRPRALKCFTRPAAGRAEAYGRLARELPRSSPYLVAHRYWADELSVWHDGRFEAFDVLAMDWVEGRTLHTEAIEAARRADRRALERLFDNFLSLARWLVGSGLAHGDLKPENIVVASDGAFKLVDYDGMYLPSMAGEAQREAGTPAWQHPARAAMPFSSAIDHYSIALVAATLEALASLPELIDRFTPAGGGLLFDPERSVVGVDPALELLEQHGLCARWLPLLASESPELPSLAKLLTADTNQTTPWVPFEYKGRWGFRRAGSEQTIAPIFDRVLPFAEGRAAVCLDGRWGYVDDAGEPIGRFAFDGAWSFSQGLGLVCRRGKYGFVGLDGRPAVPARYDRARSFSEGYAVAVVGGKYGLVDRTGKWAVAPEWDHLSNVHHKKTIGERAGEKIELAVE